MYNWFKNQLNTVFHSETKITEFEEYLNFCIYERVHVILHNIF